MRHHLILDIQSDNLETIEGQLQLLTEEIARRNKTKINPPSRGFCKNEAVIMTYTIQRRAD